MRENLDNDYRLSVEELDKDKHDAWMDLPNDEFIEIEEGRDIVVKIKDGDEKHAGVPSFIFREDHEAEDGNRYFDLYSRFFYGEKDEDMDVNIELVGGAMIVYPDFGPNFRLDGSNRSFIEAVKIISKMRSEAYKGAYEYAKSKNLVSALGNPVGEQERYGGYKPLIKILENDPEHESLSKENMKDAD